MTGGWGEKAIRGHGEKYWNTVRSWEPIIGDALSGYVKKKKANHKQEMKKKANGERI